MKWPHMCYLDGFGQTLIVYCGNMTLDLGSAAKYYISIPPNGERWNFL